MTVGPGITPGLLTLPSCTTLVVPVAKRSRAMRLSRNYRRWGVAPRPENVFCPRNIWWRSVFNTYFPRAHRCFQMIVIGYFVVSARIILAQGLNIHRLARSNS
jgi:hypothetical protein